MGRETGLMTDIPPSPEAVPVQPAPDFQLAARLVRDAEQRAVARYKNLVQAYYANLLRLASGEIAEEALPPDFQRAIALLRKSPSQIQADISESRRIVGAKAWLSTYDAAKNKAELTSVATQISKYDAEIQREIARIRSAAAPFHTKVAELQRAEFAVTHNTHQARSWDHWLEGRFEPDPQVLDRLKAAI